MQNQVLLRARIAVFWAIPTVALVALLWFITDFLLKSDRGLDLGDEGLYLLAADPPSSTASFVFPFGWHTAPLFALVGHDVSAFRTAGAVLLSLVGLWAATGAASLVSSAFGKRDQLTWVLAALAGVGGAWMYYFTLLRAPSYNWVTLVGLGIASGAALRQWAHFISHENSPTRFQHFIIIAVLGFGVAFTLPAKPTSAVFFGLVYLISAWLITNPGTALRALLQVLVSSVAWILVFVTIQWWPLAFPRVFFDALSRPLFTSDQQLVQGLENLAAIPGLAYQDFRGLSAPLVGAATLALLIIATNTFWPWKRPALLVLPYLVIYGLAPFFGRGDLQIWQQGWEEGHLGVGLLLVIAASTLIGLGAWGNQSPVSRLQLIVAVLGLIVLSAALGFGSANTPYPMMKFAALLLVTAALLPLVRIPVSSIRRVIAATVAVGAIAVSTLLIYASWGAPYASRALDLQVVAQEVGRHKSELLLDPEKASVLDSFRAEIQAAGGAKIRLIAVGPDSPGIVFASGATAPESLAFTWFGQPGVMAYAMNSLERLADPEWCDAWILTSTRCDPLR